MEHISCNLCNCNEYNLFKEIDNYRLVKCKRCGLVYLNPRPTKEEIAKEYTEKYHREKLLRKEPKTKEGIEEEINKNTARAEEIVKKFGRGGRLLDIGCGVGFFTACLRRYGWYVTGVDISEWASTFARERLGMNVLTGRIEDIQFNEHFDVITMYHVLEHLPNPLRTLKKISEIITDEGILVIKSPNLASFDRIWYRIWYGKNWRGYQLPFHLYHYTPKTYQILLEKAGFSVQKIIFQPWNPIAPLMQIGLRDSIKADHTPNVIERLNEGDIPDNFVLKGFSEVWRITTRILHLKGRDMTIYSQKRDAGRTS